MRRVSAMLALVGVLGLLMVPTGCKKETPRAKPAEKSEAVRELPDDATRPPVEEETVPLPELELPVQTQPAESVEESLPDITPGPNVEP